MRLLVLRPEPGASATADRAAAMGLDPLVSPLFVVEPIGWDPPDPARFDALMMTSANAARHGGAALARYAALPGHAVGRATADAMRTAGLAVADVGDADAAALLKRLAAAGGRRILHLCGAQRTDPDASGVELVPISVYASRPVAALTAGARAAAGAGAVALIHSPRAAAWFADRMDAARLDRGRVSLVAISDAAARAAGGGWRAVAAAAVPCDAPMLAIARALCQNRAS